MGDVERFGIKGIYLFGSTKNGTAGPGSDIDLIVHVSGHRRKRARDLRPGWRAGASAFAR